MGELSSYVLMPLMIALIFAACNDRCRKRLLSVRTVASLEARLQNADERLYWAAFALCMVAGIFARCWQFGVLPGGLNQDGTMAGVEAYCLLRDGTDQYGTSWPTYFEAWGFSQMSTLYSYVLIPFIRVLGLSRFSLRLPMLLVSVAMLLVAWDLARRIAGKGYALLTLFVLAGNPWHVLQSRWALEANLMPHVLLMGAYLLYIGRERRWALYLSMVFFALTPYAYGVACFSVPVLLAGMAVYYLAKRRARVVDVVVCAAIFGGIAAPYFVTMLINMLGLHSVTLGPITMPFFEKSLRSNDISFFQWNPYLVALENVRRFLGAFLLNDAHVHESYNAIGWASTMYVFSTPLIVFGAYRLWRDRRDMAQKNDLQPFTSDGAMLILMWLIAATVNGMAIGGVINRNNVLFYALILVVAFALWQMGRRLRVALCAALAVFSLGFCMLCVTYFTDEAYQQRIARSFHDGLQQALTDTWDWECDRYYLSIGGRADRVTLMSSQLMFAHRIDYSARLGAVQLTGPDGKPTGSYYSERYAFVDLDGAVLDSYERAVYIITQENKRLFAPEDYLITDYGQYAVAYPRVWAE